MIEHFVVVTVWFICLARASLELAAALLSQFLRSEIISVGEPDSVLECFHHPQKLCNPFLPLLPSFPSPPSVVGNH